MELIKSLKWRHASKKMSGQKVPAEKIDNILEAIRLAPSSMGLQPYTILVIKNEELRQQILPVAFNQSQIIDSSHLLVFAAWDNVTETHVGDFVQHIAATRDTPLESLGGYRDMLMRYTQRSAEENFQWSARQAYIALGIAIVAAAEERVDATPMEGFENDKLDELLNLRMQGLRSVALLPLGYRDVDSDWLASLPKVRRPRERLFIEK